EHGTVNRGVCSTDENGYLKNITECKQIGRDEEGMISYPDEEGNKVFLDKDTPVSMNMFGFYPSYFDFFEEQFEDFLQFSGEDLKSEFYIPTLIDNIIQSGLRKTKVLHSESEWFGVTYKEDKEFVSNRLKGLLEDSVYPYNLWE
ncbi:MAG: nucleotidyltransferase, partial [Saprospiraceae bacterium]